MDFSSDTLVLPGPVWVTLRPTAKGPRTGRHGRPAPSRRNTEAKRRPMVYHSIGALISPLTRLRTWRAMISNAIEPAFMGSRSPPLATGANHTINQSTVKVYIKTQNEIEMKPKRSNLEGGWPLAALHRGDGGLSAAAASVYSF